MPRAWYCAQSQSENGDSRADLRRRACGRRRRLRRVQRIGVEQAGSENAATRRDARSPRRTRAPAADADARPGYVEPERRDDERRELRPARERDGDAARATASVASQKPEDEERRHDRVVRVRASTTYCVNGIRGPGERERRAEPAAAEAQADERRARAAQRTSKMIDVSVHGRELVPLAATSRRSSTPGRYAS